MSRSEKRQMQHVVSARLSDAEFSVVADLAIIQRISVGELLRRAITAYAASGLDQRRSGR